MASHSDDRPTILKERRVLQALCKGDSEVLKTAVRLLSVRRWREPIHQIIFKCLASLSAGGPLTLRERLAECTTRKGFPDVDWELFFTSHSISSQDGEELMRQLRDLDNTEFEGRRGAG